MMGFNKKYYVAKLDLIHCGSMVEVQFKNAELFLYEVRNRFLLNRAVG